MTVRIVTDSTADLPPEIVEAHGITVVPLSVFFGDEELLDGVDITSDRFFRRLGREKTLPTTSQPSPGRFRETYERLRDDGATEIVSIHVSSKLSGTCESARQAMEGLTGVRVVLVDSLTTSLALGLGVIAAAEAVARGADADEVARTATQQFARTHVFIMLDTLEYLRRGGRIGRGMEIVGSLLHVKPLATIEDGAVASLGRARTRQKAIEALIDRASAFRPISAVAAMHATTPDDLEYLVTRLRGIAPDAPVIVNRLTPVIGVHSGPGVLAFVVVSADPQAPAVLTGTP